VAVDGSQHAKRALDTACKLLRPEQDEVMVLTCIDEYSALDVLDEELVLFAAETVEKANAELRENGTRMLTEAAEYLKARGLSYSTYLAKGNSREGIVEAAKDNKVDIVVVGSRGLGALSRLLVGSVSEYVVTHAPCPVLVVRQRNDL